MTAIEYRGLFKPVESESSCSAQRLQVIAPAPTWRSSVDEEDYEPFHEWLRKEIPLNHSTMVNPSSNGVHRVAKIGPC
ncbi:hypothetical protein E2562_037887 [Oryza meyeriana var. granulata]|uniref:Uncharacterized protein n=1 Tax=Oryza meyeriana var. granulata TaxID=110450 RepID=A0A6G1ECM8_9ORYZ|nr:hypothetical protein E2562_037887 [Oryza meyeriana var. granulata]